MSNLLTSKFLFAATMLVAIALAYFELLFSATGLVCLYFFITALTFLKITIKLKVHHLSRAKFSYGFSILHLLLFILSLPWAQTWLGNIQLYLLLFSATALLIALGYRTQLLIMTSVEKTQQVQQLTQQLQSEKTLFETTLQENQEELESHVQERTLELHIALQELEEVNRELAEKTTLDELTGLYNRRYYDQKILAEYRRSRRNLSPLSLVVIDIDHFKKVNDNHGHTAGDQCLKAVAELLKGTLLRSTDIACRYGGEEFCLILPETTAQGAELFAEELRKKVAQLSVQYSGQPIPLTISCGISTYQQQDGAVPETIFAAADNALYQAKNQGRNQVVVAEAILMKRIEE
ncbi:MAG: GGDEF domain-containing protein [Thalassotalea sp.]